jgi:hypothetical protein
MKIENTRKFYLKISSTEFNENPLIGYYYYYDSTALCWGLALFSVSGLLGW